MISKCTIRTAKPSETEGLRQLWADVFADEDLAINAFFANCFIPGLTVVAECRGEIISCGYLFRYGSIKAVHFDGECAMIYAVTTKEDYRGNGLASMVTDALVKTAGRLSIPVAALCPAEDELFDYYGSRGFITAFSVCEKSYTKDEVTKAHNCSVKIVNANEYVAARAEVLRNAPHVELNRSSASYQFDLCIKSGGGLVVIDSPGGVKSCAAVERSGGGVVLVKELLSPESCEASAVAAIREKFEGGKYVVRTPVRSGKTENVRPYGMIKLTESAENIAGFGINMWLGPAFD